MRSGATADMAPGELGQQQVVRLHQLLHEARFADPDGAHLSPAGGPRHEPWTACLNLWVAHPDDRGPELLYAAELRLTEGMCDCKAAVILVCQIHALPQENTTCGWASRRSSTRTWSRRTRVKPCDFPRLRTHHRVDHRGGILRRRPYCLAR